MNIMMGSEVGVIRERFPKEGVPTGSSDNMVHWLWNPTILPDVGPLGNAFGVSSPSEKLIYGIALVQSGPPVLCATASPLLLWVESHTSNPTQLISSRQNEGRTDRQVPETRSSSVTEAGLRVERLMKIQAAFGLSMKDFAEILRISRAQLYKWYDLSEHIELHDSNYSRLVLIDRLANYWRKRSHTPLSRFIREPLQENLTIFDLLKSSTINTTNVEVGFDLIAERLASLGPTREQRLAQAGFKRRPSHRPLTSDDE